MEQRNIKIGTHGEQYGNWMSNPVFYMLGGVFALQDDMKPGMYGDMDSFVKELKAAGYEEVRLVDTTEEIFGSRSRRKCWRSGHRPRLWEGNSRDEG